MKTLIILVSALTLLACNPPVTTCKYGPITVYGDVELDCTKVTKDLDIMRVAFEKPVREAYPGLDPDSGYSFEELYPTVSPVSEFGGFDKAFEGYDIVVQDGANVHCNGEDVVGCNRGSTSYLPSTNSGALMHESLHFLQWKNGTTPKVMHDGWFQNGYTSMSDAYYWNVKDGWTKWYQGME